MTNEEVQYSKPPDRPKSEWEKLLDKVEEGEMKEWDYERTALVNVEKEKQVEVGIKWKWKF